MRKLVINLIVLLFIALPITLIGSYTLAYEILINQVEVEEVVKIENVKIKCVDCGHENTDKNECENCGKSLIVRHNINKSYPKLLCDGCYQEKEKVTPYLLKDINTNVNLCDDCLEVFSELEKEENQ